MSIKKIALSQVRIQIELDKFRVLDLQIENQSNTHGRMLLKLELDDEVAIHEASCIKGSVVSALLPNYTYLFSGVCTETNIEDCNGYKTLEVEVCTLSWLLDRTPNTQTFQSPSKRLRDIIDEIIGRYGGFLRLQDNPNISTVIYQQKETDWAFIKRIANQYQQEIYVNTQSNQLDMAIGICGLKVLQLEPEMQIIGISKKIGEQRLVMANTDPSAASYQFIEEEYLCEDLTIIPGDIIGKDTVKENRIINVGGLLENHIVIAKTTDVKADYEAATSSVNFRGILTGTVLEVNGNKIQVQLDTDVHDMKGNCVEIPYESVVSNSFYCMPDEKDQVFIYHESNGIIVCLGSKRMEATQADYQKPEEKVLTLRDKMIRFTSSAVKLTDTRDKHDAEDDTEISIILDDSDGITITSGSNVVIETTDSGTMSLIALDGAFAADQANRELQSGKFKYAKSYQEGNIKYEGERGLDSWEQYKMATGEYFSRKGRDLKNNFQSTVDSFTFKNIRDLVSGRLGQENESNETNVVEAEEENQYETGVITIYGLNVLTFQVQESFLILDADIFINAPQFGWLGYTKGEHAKVEEEFQDWWEFALDGLQLALDLCGFIPIFGAFFDIANAAVSLARGDVCGAAMSLVCAIPGVGDACAALKIGGKVAMKAIKIADMVRSAPRIVKIAKLIYSGVTLVDQGIGTGVQIREIANEISEGKFDLSNPNDLAKLLGVVKSVGGMVGTGVDIYGGVKDLKGGSGNGQQSGGDDGDGTQAPRQNGDDGDGTQAPRQDGDDGNTQRPQDQSNEGPQNDSATSESAGDPINVVTGSLMAEYVDLGLEDVLGSFSMKRFYESAYDNRGGILGNKWRFELESSVQVTGNLAVLQMPDLHMERFVKENGIWRNQRAGDTSLVFSETVDGYLLKKSSTGEIYEYNAAGKLVAMSDIHGNKKLLSYEGGKLQRIILASGQWVEFTYQGGKLLKVRDCLGREVEYKYKNNYLTEVRLPNGGTMYYEYTPEGYLTALTDLNGKCYSRNFYDRKGRVIRQELEGGEEYVAFYDDAQKQNTFLTTSTGENIIYTYGREEKVTHILYPDQTTEERRYDVGKNMVYEKDRLAREIYREYNEAGMLTKEQLPDGLVKYLEYDERNLPVHVWDNAGREIRNIYDEAGNMTENRIRQNEKTELVTTFTYDRRGRIRTVTDPEGHTESYSYETEFSEPSLYTTATGADIRYRYDAGGRLMEKTDAFGSTTYGYNAMGHCTIRRDPEGNTTRYFYDNMANLVKEIRPNAYNPITDDGPGREFTFDVWTYLSRVVEADGGVYHYENDFRGNCLRQWSPGETYGVDEPGTRYEYDINHHRIRTFHADGGVLREVYDVCGNLLKRILPESYDEKSDDGAGYQYTYDACNRLVEIKNPLGIVEMRYVYDLCGNIIKEIPAKGYLMGDTDENRIGTLYRYDLRGNVTEIRVPLVVEEDGSVNYRLTTFRYDKLNNCVEEKRFQDYQSRESAHGRVNIIRYGYDKGGRLVTITDSTGAQIEYAYNERNQRIMEKQKISGSIWQERHYEYSPAGNIIRVAESADEKGCGKKYVSTRFTYDKNGNITRIQTPTGHEILREYDVCDRLTAEIHKEKNGSIHSCTTYTYDQRGNLTQRCTGGDYKTSYAYDRMNRLVEEINSDGGKTLHRYNRNGNLTRRIYPAEYAAHSDKSTGYCYTYDILGRNTDIHSPEGRHIRKVTYNMFGEKEHEGDGISGVNIAYDFAGRRSVVTTDGGRSQAYRYDALGNIIGLKDGNGNTTEYATDLWGRITTLTGPDGTRELYTYDEAGNMLTATDGNGNTVTYHFNCLNKLAERTDAAGETETFRYDLEGRLCEHTDRNGLRSLYRYNMFGSPTLHQSPETGLTESWEYDSQGRLKSATAGGMRYEYSYYSNGLLKEKKASGRTLLSYAYDLDGNKISRRDITGKETAYTYNKDDLLTAVLEGGRTLAAYTYHADGNVDRLSIGTSLTTQYDYDIDRNLQGIKTMDGTNVLADSTFSYDGNANRTEKKGLEGLTRYSYDANNRLIEVQYPHILGNLKDGNTAFEKLSYDKAGNRTLRVTESLTEQYHYDNCNRLTRLDTTPTDLSKCQTIRFYRYDKQGNMLSDGANTYSYDGFNRVAEVCTEDGSIQKNRYDAEGLRHEMEENGQLVKFLYNENREVEVEEEASGNIIRYIRGLGIISSDSESARTYYHYVSDEQGSVTHILEGENKAVAEACGAEEPHRILNRYTYDAFGNTIECTEQVHNRFRYNGEQYDPVTSQYYLRARFYNPAIARFTQEDTYYGDGLNLYQYCANNPIVYKDPSGHNICPGQLDLYKKYKAEGMSPKEAYDQMRKDLGLSKENPFTADSEGGTKAWYQRDDLKDLSLYDAFEKIKAEKGLTIDNPYANPNKGDSTSTKPGFEDWLNRGASDNKVYFGIDKNKKPSYTGITKQTKEARLYQHNRNGKDFLDLEIQYDNLTRNQARAIEQYFIEKGPNTKNDINSISINHRYYDEAMEWAKKYLGKE